MRKQLYGVVTAVAVLALAGAGTAAATNANGNHDGYVFLVGEGPAEGPDVAMAPDGSTITLTGSGMLQAGPSNSATGGGPYTLKNAAGATVGSGTWSVTGVLGFVSYGNGTPQGLPDFTFGGQAKLNVTLSNGSAGVLTVTCLLGSPPAGKEEGVTLILGNGGNYTHSAGGQTVFLTG